MKQAAIRSAGYVCGFLSFVGMAVIMLPIMVRSYLYHRRYGVYLSYEAVLESKRRK